MHEVIAGAAYIGRFLREVGEGPVTLLAPGRDPRQGRFVERVDGFLLFAPDDASFLADPCGPVQIQGMAGSDRFTFTAPTEGLDEGGRLIVGLPQEIERFQSRHGDRAGAHSGLLLRVGVDGELVDLDLVDLAENGLAFTGGELAFQVGQRLRGHLELEENHYVPVTLEVRHLRPDGVVGAEVVDISLGGKRELSRIAQGLPGVPLPVVTFGFKDD